MGDTGAVLHYLPVVSRQPFRCYYSLDPNNTNLPKSKYPRPWDTSPNNTCHDRVSDPQTHHQRQPNSWSHYNTPVGPPTRHRHHLLDPRARPPSRRNPSSLEHPNALQDQSQSRHRLRPPPSPHRPKRLPPQTPPRKRLHHEPSSRSNPSTDHVAAHLPSQRDFRHDPLRQTFLLGLFERSQRQTKVFDSPYVETNDVEVSECDYDGSTNRRFGRAESQRFNRAACEAGPPQQYQQAASSAVERHHVRERVARARDRFSADETTACSD